MQHLVLGFNPNVIFKMQMLNVLMLFLRPKQSMLALVKENTNGVPAGLEWLM